MHLKPILLLGLLNVSLMASPVLEPRPNEAYFARFQPVKAPTYPSLILKTGDRLAICGDSITQQQMYSRIMEDYLTMCAPQLNISVRQYGWNGERAADFLLRMTNDCLRFNPTIATTSYGMNDFNYRPYEDSAANIYYTSTLQVIQAFKAHGVRVVLGSPGCISQMPPWVESPSYSVEDMNVCLCDYRNIDVKIAKEENVRFADAFWPMFNAGFVGRQEYGADYAIPGREGVHPYWAGHLIIAYAYLKAMGLDGNIGTFTVDLKRNEMAVSKGHHVRSVKDGEFTIESSRYPFCPCEPDGQAAVSFEPYPVCGKDDVATNDSIRSGMTLVPFNQELNRLMLVVKNASAAHYQVSWGNNSKTFTCGQLAAGINLALEFPENPFTSTFAKVDAAIVDKQAYETEEVMNIFHGTDMCGLFTPAMVVRTDRAVEATEKKHDVLIAAVHSAFRPVTHVIRITAQ